MNAIRWLVVSGALLGFAALPLHAQTQTAPPPDAAKAAAKAPAPKKKEAVKDAPVKDAKMDAAKKDDKKKATAKAAAKDDRKKAAPKKADAAAKKPTVYSNTKSMEIRDDKGNVIPTNPDAYDVSSALPAKSPPKK